MSFVIFKKGKIGGNVITILVNDTEGIPIEFETFEAANKIAQLFEANSLHKNIYTVHEIKDGI